MVKLCIHSDVRTLTPSHVRRTAWHETVRRTVKMFAPTLPAHISIALIGDESMRTANKQSRAVDRVTDVLSFLYSPDDGEVLICVPQAHRQFRRFKSSSLETEVRRLAIHGMLHLAGFDHTVMKEKNLMNSMAKKIIHALKKI